MTLVLEKEGDWVRCVGGQNKAFVEFLKYGLKPTAYRQYNAADKIWSVHWTKLPALASIARRCFAHVDWSSLPEEWQVYLVGGSAPGVVDTSTPQKNPYSVLFITEDAPLEVVRAAYKALAALHHPDVNGCVEKMAEINNAYAEIRKQRTCE